MQPLRRQFCFSDAISRNISHYFCLSNRSFKFRQKKHSDAYFQKIRADLSYCVLSTQFLTELRDRFQCQLDYVVPGDFSEDPLADKEGRNRELYPSGSFFIENTFYNDFRVDNVWATPPGGQRHDGIDSLLLLGPNCPTSMPSSSKPLQRFLL